MPGVRAKQSYIERIPSPFVLCCSLLSFYCLGWLVVNSDMYLQRSCHIPARFTSVEYGLPAPTRNKQLNQDRYAPCMLQDWNATAGAQKGACCCLDG